LNKKLDTKSIFLNNQERKCPPGFDKTLVWLHNIRSLHNVGSIFRSADSFGIDQLILSGYTPRPPRAEISKTALGADEYVDWVCFDTIETALEYINRSHYRFVGFEQTTESIPINDLKYDSKPTCLILGNEINGIDDGILPYLDVTVEIPQYGRKHSLNVSVAAGIALFHLHELYRKQSK
jgi:tRNA G18 (ribose-2'-O)-methylase SpoU